MSLKHSFLLILSLILFGACRESEKSKSQIHEILPLNTVWLAEINDWEEVIAKKSNSRVLDLLSQFGNIKNFHSHWRNAAELSNQDSLQELMSSSQVYLAEILSGADRYN